MLIHTDTASVATAEKRSRFSIASRNGLSSTAQGCSLFDIERRCALFLRKPLNIMA